jgi:hypothetical protein
MSKYTMPSSLEEWIGRSDDQKTLRYRQPPEALKPTTSLNPRGVPALVDDDSMKEWLMSAAQYGMALQRYEKARHLMDVKPSGDRGMVVKPTANQLPLFPAFPSSVAGRR